MILVGLGFQPCIADSPLKRQNEMEFSIRLTKGFLTMIEQIVIAATNLRKALEQLRDAVQNDEEYSIFRSFPDGACEDTSAYLGRYLIRENIVNAARMEVPAPNFSNDEGYCHAWLRIDGKLHVDITGDQFDTVDKPVIVTEVSRFHAGFRVSEWQRFEDLERRVFEDLASKIPYISWVWEQVEPGLPRIKTHK